jgi:hypothetical protein
MAELPDPYTHFVTNAGAAVEPGVYRVVGTTEGKVTLLRVADEDGTRRHTGHVVQVSVTTLVADFDPTENPDAGFSLRGALERIGMSLKAAVGLW